MTSNENFKKLTAAACRNDFAVVEAMLDSGFDKEAVDEYEEPIFSDIVFNLLEDAIPERYEIVKRLIKLGFNPQYLDADGCGALTHAMLSMDTQMLEVLLQGGAQANTTAGFKSGETIYDWAVFDYMHQVWEFAQIPEKLAGSVMQSEDARLEFLDKMALQYNKRRPDHLLLLRKYGAKSGLELGM